MTSKEFAIKVCAYLAERKMWVGTMDLMKCLEINETRGFVRSNLKHLRRLEVLKQRGSGKYFWQIANENYDKENPFNTKSTKPLRGKLMEAFPGMVRLTGDTFNNREAIKNAGGTDYDSITKSWQITLVNLAKIKNLVENYEELIGDDKDDDGDEAKDGEVKSTGASNPALIAKVAELEKQVHDLNEQIKILDQARKVEITIKMPSGTQKKIEDKVHPIFTQVLFHVSCGDNVMLIGPKGCGKTFLAKQLAKHLGLAHGMLSLSGGVTEGKIFGRTTPNITNGKSEYQSTQFVDLWEGGGLFLWDEIDAADPNVVLSLNGALADGELPLDRPKKPLAKRHKDFVGMAAANTWGNGADRQYVGRNQQDSAFTERFVQIAMDYDAQLELSLCPGGEEMVATMHKYRNNMFKNRVERTLSTRFIQRAYNWLQHGKDVAYAESMLFAGWRNDEIQKVKGF